MDKSQARAIQAEGREWFLLTGEERLAVIAECWEQLELEGLEPGD